MDFHSYPQQQMHVTNIHSLHEYDEEEDVFYDELRRQVLQLTAEDNDDHENVCNNKMLNRVEARKHGPLFSFPRHLCCYNWPGIKEDCGATPAWMLNLWRSGNGTGVFIPQTTLFRRKNRPRRKNGGGRTYKQTERMN